MRLAAALLALVPRVALACPACAGNGRYTGARLMVLGSFVLLPFAIFATGAWIVRGLQKGASDIADRSGQDSDLK